MKGLKHILFTVLALAVVLPSYAARKKKASPEPVVEAQELTLEVESPYRGFNWRVDENGDSIIVFYLRNITVFPPEQFKNKKDEEFFWRTVRDVKLTLPYARLIAETLIETYEYIETFPTQKEREDYLKSMEKALFEQYKPILKRFSKRQAKVLLKLIQRQTHQSGYEIVKAFLGSFRATFWQGFGKLFGVSLKSTFDPKNDAADATLDRIARRVEEGTL